MDNKLVDNKIKIGALWKKESKSGKVFFTGNFGDAKIIIFDNTFKKESKHPDYVMYIAPRDVKPTGPVLSQDDLEFNQSNPFANDEIPF